MTVEDKTNICTNYFDTPNSRNYFKKNFEETETLNGSPYLVGLALCNTPSVYKHISIDEIGVHLVIAKFVTRPICTDLKFDKWKTNEWYITKNGLWRAEWWW